MGSRDSFQHTDAYFWKLVVPVILEASFVNSLWQLGFSDYFPFFGNLLCSCAHVPNFQNKVYLCAPALHVFKEEFPDLSGHSGSALQFSLRKNSP